MKKFFSFSTIALVAVSLSTAAFAVDYTKGTVKKLDTKTGKVTLMHGELKNLGMPAMTMVFRVKEDAMLGKLKEGAKIEFVAERIGGKLTVVDIK